MIFGFTLVLSGIAILFFLPVMLSIPNNASASDVIPNIKKYQTYDVVIDGQIHKMDYDFKDGLVEEIEKTGEYYLSITVSDVVKDTTLELVIPMETYRSIFYSSRDSPIGGELLVLNNREEAGVVTFNKITCDEAVLSIPVNADTELIILTQMLPVSGQIHKIPETSLSIPLHTPNGIVHVGVITSSKQCVFSLLVDEKRLNIDLVEYADGSMYVELPQTVLGGPYEFYVDNKKTDAILTEIKTIPFDSNGKISAISLNYSGAKTIDIIGTTVIPEFPTGIVVLLCSIAFVAILGNARIVKRLH